MTAIDACVVIWFLADRDCAEVEAFIRLLGRNEAVLPPSIVAELLSDPAGGAETAALVRGLRTLEVTEEYWHRAGLLRAKVKRAGRKAALGDTLAAQACLDADVAFLTGDGDFRAFAEIAGLRLWREPPPPSVSARR